MKEKKYILLCNLVSAYKDLSKIYDGLDSVLEGSPEVIGKILDKISDMVIDTLGISENDDSRNFFGDEFYYVVNGNDVEDTIQHMLDKIKEYKDFNSK